MAAFDPFANQGGPAAWDPQHHDNSRELADRLLREIDEEPATAPPSDADPTDTTDLDDDAPLAPEFTD